jgi:hypothetical protein
VYLDHRRPLSEESSSGTPMLRRTLLPRNGLRNDLSSEVDPPKVVDGELSESLHEPRDNVGAAGNLTPLPAWVQPMRSGRISCCRATDPARRAARGAVEFIAVGAVSLIAIIVIVMAAARRE